MEDSAVAEVLLGGGRAVRASGWDVLGSAVAGAVKVMAELYRAYAPEPYMLFVSPGRYAKLVAVEERAGVMELTRGSPLIKDVVVAPQLLDDAACSCPQAPAVMDLAAGVNSGDVFRPQRGWAQLPVPRDPRREAEESRRRLLSSGSSPVSANGAAAYPRHSAAPPEAGDRARGPWRRSASGLPASAGADKYLPSDSDVEEIVRRLRERGIDVEDVLIAALAKQDPQESVRLRISLAERYMAECEEYLKEGDPVQASEKAYKVAEEVVKALAEKFGIPEFQMALKEGRWYTYLLGKASNTLARMLGGWIADGWSNAYFLHVWGFHEAKLAVEDMTSYVNRVKEMLNEAKKVLAA